MSSRRLAAAGLAGALAVVLLSGPGTTAASWVDTTTVSAAPITAGRLEVDAVEQSFTVTRPDGSAAAWGATPLAVGDTIVLTSTVAVRAEGDTLAATLALDTSALQLVIGGLDLSGHARIAVTSSLPAAGPHGVSVTGDDDGATATATVTWTIPATTDGRPRAADRSNWWGERLQHQTVDPGALSWRLVQDA